MAAACTALSESGNLMNIRGLGTYLIHTCSWARAQQPPGNQTRFQEPVGLESAIE